MDNEDSIEELRLAKQQYLIQEIIERGYDPADFVAFCDTKRGSNIDLWEINELIGIVNEFKAIVDRALQDEQLADDDVKEIISEASSDSRSEDSQMSPLVAAAETLGPFSPLEDIQKFNDEPVAPHQDHLQLNAVIRSESPRHSSEMSEPDSPDEVLVNGAYDEELKGAEDTLSLKVHSGSTIETLTGRPTSYEARLDEELKANPMCYSILSQTVQLSPLSICPPPIISVSE
jgi:hypothetical protein